jgi:hypothetical protein
MFLGSVVVASYTSRRGSLGGDSPRALLDRLDRRQTGPDPFRKLVERGITALHQSRIVVAGVPPSRSSRSPRRV